MKLNLLDINSLIEQGRIKEQDPLYNLSKGERPVLGKAIGIAYSKYHDNGNGEAALIKYFGFLNQTIGIHFLCLIHLQ